MRKTPGKFMEVGNPIGTLFLITSSSKSPQILKYSKDSESNLA
jgi:hypothetical protein